MIRTKRELLGARAAIAELEQQIEADRAHWAGMGMSADDVEEMIQPSRLRLAELRDEVALYERIEAGDLSMFESFDDYGKAIIAARIAQGITQRDLADRLGVHEAQISRDERNEYRGIGVERLAQLFNALGLEYSGVFRLSFDNEVPAIPLRTRIHIQQPFVFRKAASLELDPDDVLTV